MFAMRAVCTSSRSGDGRFDVAVGPSREARTMRGWLGASTVAAASAGLLLLTRGSDAGTALSAPGVLGVLWLAAEWIGGGSETLACRGDILSHRRRRLFRRRDRTCLVLDVTRVRSPRGRGPWSGIRGLRIETAAGEWAIGAGIPRREARELATALERHLTVSSPAGLLAPRASRFRAPRISSAAAASARRPPPR